MSLEVSALFEPDRNNSKKSIIIILAAVFLLIAGTVLFFAFRKTPDKENDLPVTTSATSERNSAAETTLTQPASPVTDGTVLSTDTSTGTTSDAEKATFAATSYDTSSTSLPTETTAENSSGIKSGDVITFGKYEQDNKNSNVMEDIEWMVLRVEDGKALLMSKYALDCKQFHDNMDKYKDWGSCALRSWLNEDFYDIAFSADEKDKIVTTTVRTFYDYTNGDATRYSDDKLFVLDRSELWYVGNSEALKCVPTKYARAKGASVTDGYCVWWLRSMGYSCIWFTEFINDEGDVNDHGRSVEAECGIRPVMWITPD